LDAIFLHDYRRKGKIHISYYQDDTWINISSDKLLNKYHWNEHKLAISTQKIRLEMQTWKAWINEIALYGYSTTPGMKNETVKPENILTDLSLELAETKIFPNPASEMLFIECSSGNTNITLFNNQGRLIQSTSSRQLNVSELPGGMYFVRITDLDSKFTKTERLIISH